MNDVEKLVEDNLALAKHFAGRYLNSGIEYDDLYSEALIGLLKASKTWDPTKSKFSTYAGRCIINQILMYIRKNERHKYMGSRSLYLDSELDFGDGSIQEFHAIVADAHRFEENIVFNSYMSDINAFISSNFKPRDKQILIWHHGLNGEDKKNQYEISMELGITQSYVSRLISSCNKKLLAYVQELVNKDVA